VLVKTPPKRKKSRPVEYRDDELFRLSELEERPPTFETPPETDAGNAPPEAGSRHVGGTAMQVAAHKMLEKARAEQEREEAEERESSAERFTEGLLVFLAEPNALVRLGILAVVFQMAMTLLRWASTMTISEDAPPFLSEVGSVVITLAMAIALIVFLSGMAACARALVVDTSNGLLKIENWPGINLRNWGGEVFYIVNASIVAALPGAAVGFVLAFAGISGWVLFTAAASFVVLFPPTLLSMFESESALAPVSKDVWRSIRGRPNPWNLTYLITGVATAGGLIAFYISLVNPFFVGLVGAVPVVACLMIIFRAMGRLMCILSGREDQTPAGRK
jgi:hypothetical protein